MGTHRHDHSDSTGNLRIAFFLNLAFTLVEFAGGLWTNSIAILADCVHDLGDSISLGLAWYFDRISDRGNTPHHTYGHRRYRLLGALIAGLTLLIGISFVIYHAVGRLFNPGEVHVPGMFAIAIAGVVFNGIAVLRLKHGSSLTEKMVSWHLLEDLLGWIAVLVGAAMMYVWDLPFLDPLLSLGISIFVLWNVVKNLRQVFAVILQKAPEDFDVADFEERALQIEGVVSLHHVHCWSIDGESHVLSAHLVIEPGISDIAKLKNRVRELIDDSFEHVTLETEVAGEICPVENRDGDNEKS